MKKKDNVNEKKKDNATYILLLEMLVARRTQPLAEEVAQVTQADEDRFQIQSSHQGYVPRVWWTPPHDAVVEPIRVP